MRIPIVQSSREAETPGGFARREHVFNWLSLPAGEPIAHHHTSERPPDIDLLVVLARRERDIPVLILRLEILELQEEQLAVVIPQPQSTGSRGAFRPAVDEE